MPSIHLSATSPRHSAPNQAHPAVSFEALSSNLESMQLGRTSLSPEELEQVWAKYLAQGPH